MPNIFEYTNYRSFLKDYYDEEKHSNPSFSYENFSHRVGVKSKGFIHNIISGLRNVANANTYRLAQAMKLNSKETDYFVTLVSFNQATNLEEKNHLYEKLSSSKGIGKTSAFKIIQDKQFEFYSKYYHSIIRSLIDMVQFKDDYNWLAKNVYPRITPLQAKKSVQLLEKLGLIEKKDNGFYKVSNKTISTPNEVKSLALLNFHVETGHLAIKAMSELPKEERNISGLTLGISRKAYEKICNEINESQNRILKIAENDEGSDSVYRLNYQFFPVSNRNISRRGVK